MAATKKLEKKKCMTCKKKKRANQFKDNSVNCSSCNEKSAKSLDIAFQERGSGMWLILDYKHLHRRLLNYKSRGYVVYRVWKELQRCHILEFVHRQSEGRGIEES